LNAQASVTVRRLTRFSVAIATPFDDQNGIEWKTYTAHARDLLDAGATSVTLFGTTGEGASLTMAERRQALVRLSDAGVSLDLTVMTARGLTAEDIAENCRYALEAGCGAVLLAPPVTVGGLDPVGVLSWYRSVFEHIGGGARDIILYNIPSVTGVTMTSDVVSNLRGEFPELVAGVKDSSGDWDYHHGLLSEHSDIAILQSHEPHLARALNLGAAGTISGLANFQPSLVADLLRGCDDERVVNLVKLVMSGGPPVPILNDLTAHVSGNEAWSRVRAPLVRLSPPSQKKLRAAYDALFSEDTLEDP
jgi:4-hydroxy-tetrahydrodipicolinate synthase